MSVDFASVNGKLYPPLFLRLVVLFTLLFVDATIAASQTPDSTKAANVNLAQEKSGQALQGKVLSYIDEPLEQLIRDAPDLQTLQPVGSQQELAMILQKTSARVDEFLRNQAGVIGDEQITQRREESQTEATQEVQDSYVIVRRNGTESKLEEYRADSNGNRLTEVGRDKSYFVNTGFASSRQYFSTAFQPQHDFRYLGKDVLDSRETYVVAFAQKPPQRAAFTLKDTGAPTQGIAWVDKTNFQIIQIQTDLLVPQKEMGLSTLRMLVKFSEVLPVGRQHALWLPAEARVHADVGEPPDFEQKFRNEHYFTNYRLYDAATASVARPETSAQNPYANTHPYLEEPLETLVKRIPELKTLQPATDQQLLRMILQKTGERVDKVFGSLTGLKAKEVVSEQEFSWAKRWQLLQDQYDYFIVRRGNLAQASLEEFRRDAEGDESTPATLFLSGGFALSVRYFSIALQEESNYLFLGEEMVGTRSTYVVAFAQIPGKATISVQPSIQHEPEQLSQFDPRMRKVDVLVQGIAWIDRSSFQILRVQTDLLASKIHWDVPAPFFDKTLQKLTTTVTFSEVQSPELPNTTWMPSEADVHTVIEQHYWNPESGYELYQDRWFHNTHRFSDYQPYREPDSLARIELREDEEAHPYLEEPLKQLIKRIPELQGIRPAADQQALPMILAKTGERVDEFFYNLVDLIAHEEITQAQLSRSGAVLASEAVGDSYLILRHGSKKGADIDEYRMDKKGHEMDEVGLDKGFFVTSGFALSSVHFSTSFQWDSRSLYLGDQNIGGLDTYVVAYAQLPKRATIKVTLKGPRGATVHMLTQGIVWVDKRNFHILRMRTDLLARQPEIGLDEQTTKVNFTEVHLADLATPLWLPHNVTVYAKFGKFGDQRYEAAFLNVHHYTNYRRYRVSTKIVVPH